MDTRVKKKDLHPAHWSLEAAVVVMAVRYASAYADWATALAKSDRACLAHRVCWERRFKALQRLTAALARST